MAQSASPVKTGKSPAKAKQSSKSISISSPKTFQDFTIDAMVNLNDRKGLTRASLVNYIKQNHATELDTKKINNRLKVAINKLISENRVTQDQEDLKWNRSRFKLEKKFKDEIKKLKNVDDDETPKKITMPKKSSAKKEKPKDETKQTKKTAASKKAMTKSPKKASKETLNKVSKESTPKKAKTMKKN